MITPQAGFKIDPLNPNQVIRDTSQGVIPISTLTSNPIPLNVQQPPQVPPPDIKNIPITTPSGAIVDAKGNITTPPPVAPASDLTSRLEDLQTKLLGKPAAEATAVNQATGGFQSSLNELNTQIKMHQANALARQEEALKSGETLRYSTGLAGQVARTDAIEAMKLSALAQGMQGNILLAEKQAKNAVEAEYGQTIKDIQTARQNILNNYETFTAAEKKRADATLLSLNEKDAFVERSKADREQSYKIGIEAAKNGLTDTSLLNQIQNSTPEKALELASPYLKEKEKPIIKEFERNGRQIRQSLDPFTNKVISETDLGVKENEEMMTGNAGKDADTILSGTSTLKLADLSVKDNYRAKVAAELDKRKKEALKSGNFLGVIRASAGGKDVDTTFLQAFEKGINVVYQVGDLQAEIKNEITGPILGTLRSVNPYDVKARLIKAQLTAITPNLARGVYGEVGVLTDNDIRLYSQTLPTLKNPEDVRNAILGMTVRSLQRSLENKIKVQAGFGRDVSGIENVYLEVKTLADKILDPFTGTKTDLSELDFKFRNTENTNTTTKGLTFPSGDISLSNSLSGLNFKF